MAGWWAGVKYPCRKWKERAGVRGESGRGGELGWEDGKVPCWAVLCLTPVKFCVGLILRSGKWKMENGE